MSFTDDYHRRIGGDIVQFRKDLAKLEAGEARFGGRQPDGSWGDGTAKLINHLKHTISIYEKILNETAKANSSAVRVGAP
jgi:hypothetical protein